MSLPGHRVHRFLATRVDPATLRHVVEPAIADLQFEAAEARTRARRILVLARGYAALFRVLFLHIVDWNRRARRAAIVLMVGAAGGTLWVWTRASGVDVRVANGWVILMLFAAPLLLRLLGAGTTYRSLFANTAFAGVLMFVAVDAHAFRYQSMHPSWWALLVQLLIIGAAMSAFSAVTVTAAWSRATGVVASVRSVLLRLFGAAAIAASTFSVLNALHSHALSPTTVALLPFLTCFSALLLAPALPILLGARARIHTRLWLALVGVLCSPVAMAAAAYANAAGPSELLVQFNEHPLGFAVGCLPFVAGSAALGWMLVGKHPIACERFSA